MRLQEQIIEPTILYRYFDDNNRLLYVGITKDQRKRFSSHNRKSLWMTDAVRCTLEHFETREKAKAAETRAIQDEYPLHNIAETARKNKIRLSPEAHLVQMTGSPDNGFDPIHQDFAKDLIETIYTLPSTGWDGFEYLGFAYDLLSSNTHKSYPNLQYCESCLAIKNDAKISLAIERAKIKIMKEEK